MARMDMGVDESRGHQLVACVDLLIDLSLKAFADEQHGIAVVDQFSVAPERVMAAVMTDQPAAGDARAHGKSSPISVHPHSDNLGRRMQPPVPFNNDVRARGMRRLSA